LRFLSQSDQRLKVSKKCPNDVLDLLTKFTLL
jgi:hypothetical protein